MTDSQEAVELIPHPEDAQAPADAPGAAPTDDRAKYAAELHLDEIASHDVRGRLLAFAVAFGPLEAVAVLQRALGVSHPSLAIDGVLGPQTLTAANAADPEQLVPAMCAFERAFYIHLVTVRPALLPELAGLLNRTDA